MRKPFFLSLIVGLLCFTSCTKYFYQVYSVEFDNELKLDKKLIVYEDTNCVISYNLWDDRGNPGFTFFNRTDSIIILKLDHSFFIKNQKAYPYYLQRTYTKSNSIEKSKSSSSKGSVSLTGVNYYDYIQTNRIDIEKNEGVKMVRGNELSYNEFNYVIIPPKASREIYEYKISSSLYRDCDLFKYPKRKQVNIIKFDSIDTPLYFRNHIEYKAYATGIVHIVDNEFWVQSVTNLPEKGVILMRKDAFCGQSSKDKKKYFKSYGPNQFYIKYTKKEEHWKH